MVGDVLGFDGRVVGSAQVGEVPVHDDHVGGVIEEVPDVARVEVLREKKKVCETC